MLDIIALEQQFDTILNSFGEKELRQWLEFAEERELMECLERGECVWLDNPIYPQTNFKNTVINTMESDIDSTYPIAA
jgi:hypothetical protein